MNNSYASLVSTLRVRAAKTPGATKDLAKCFDHTTQYYFAESTMTYGEKMGVNFKGIFELPQKQIFRTTGLLNALLVGMVGDFDYTHARILCAMRLAGVYDLNRDALKALAAGVRVTTANTRGITSSAVNAMFSRSHNKGTVDTKVSNMCGGNGFSQVIGMTFAEPGKKNSTVTLNVDHPLIVRFFEVIDSASLGQIAAMNEKGAKDD